MAYCIKLLLPPEEAEVIQGRLPLLESLTQARGVISAAGHVYPGTRLRELRVVGRLEAVLNGASLVVYQIHSARGAVSGGEAGVDPQEVATKVALPARAAQALAAGMAQTIGQSVGFKLSVVACAVPQGQPIDLSEQVVSLRGAITGFQNLARSLVALLVGTCEEPMLLAWADRSNCGPEVPGLDLFSGPPSSWPDVQGLNLSLNGGGAGGGGGGGGGGDFGAMDAACGAGAFAAVVGEETAGPMQMRVLISIDEASCLRAVNGAYLRDVRQATGADVELAPEGELYPGTVLQLLRVQGSSPMVAATAVGQVLGKVVEAKGCLLLGEPSLEQGMARLKVVIPAKAATAVIGPAGQISAHIRESTKMSLHIDPSLVPPGPPRDTSEQVVCFEGPIDGAQTALSLMAEILSQFAREPWLRAWAAWSWSGQSFPGLQLFQAVQDHGKGKTKGKIGFGKGKGQSGLTMKLLVSQNEAGCVLGKGGSVVREIGEVTGTRMAISRRDEYFPGTQLQEIKIQGNPEATISTVAMVYGKISEASGSVNGGEHGVERGGCRIRIAIPCTVAQAILGPDGSGLSVIKDQTGMTGHIHETTIPEGPVTSSSEQVISLKGPLDNSMSALKLLGEVVMQYANEPWYEQWAMSTNCRDTTPGKRGFKGGKDGPGKGPRNGGPGAIKVLISEQELATIRQDPQTLKQMQLATGCSHKLGNGTYPGTSLQEITLRGANGEAAFQAIMVVLTALAEANGLINCGDGMVPPGEARVKLVVPKRAAAAVIGPQGSTQKQIKAETNVNVRVDNNSIPCGDDLFEQAVFLYGPMANLRPAIGQVIQEVDNFSGETWFDAWAGHSNAGMVIPGLELFSAKGKGK